MHLIIRVSSFQVELIHTENSALDVLTPNRIFIVEVNSLNHAINVFESNRHFKGFLEFIFQLFPFDSDVLGHVGGIALG